MLLSRALCLCGGLGLLVGAAHAQKDLVGPRQYPQLRGISGLPGGGFGVTPDGRPSLDGALSYSSPIAYSLRGGRSAIAVSSISKDLALRFSSSAREDFNTDANGTGAVMVGFDLGKFAHLTVAYEVVSGKLDQGYNFLLTPRQDTSLLQYAIGVVDVTGHVGSSGQDVPGDEENSASPFVVATAPLPGGLFGSFGIGARRYRFGFISISAPAFRSGRAVIEHDGFNFNAMLAYQIPRLKLGRSGAIVLHGGLTRLKYTTVGLAVTC